MTNVQPEEEKRACVRCKKVIPVNQGVILLRGASFACKECHEKEQHEIKDKNVCEFC